MSLKSATFSDMSSGMSSSGSGVFGGGLTGHALIAGVSIGKLDGGNYHVWVMKMQLILQSAELWEVVSGEEPKPLASAAADAVAAWSKKDNKARVYVCLGLVDS